MKKQRSSTIQCVVSKNDNVFCNFFKVHGLEIDKIVQTGKQSVYIHNGCGCLHFISKHKRKKRPFLFASTFLARISTQ